MSGQTKLSRLLPWLIALAVALGLAVLASYFQNRWLLTSPWLFAEMVATEIAIDGFRNNPVAMDTYDLPRLQALSGLLFLLVIGPSLWLYGEIKNRKSEDKLKKGVSWYAGAVIVIAGLLIVVPGSIFRGISFHGAWESAAVSENKDVLRMELSRMAYDASDLYHLPRDFGGAEGDFRSIPGESDSLHAVQLSDLKSFDAASSNSFVLAPVESDSAIIIYGIGHKPGPDPDFENANGEQGKLQMAVEVTPSGRIVTFVEENTNAP
jgi:hypothetical protein